MFFPYSCPVLVSFRRRRKPARRGAIGGGPVDARRGRVAGVHPVVLEGASVLLREFRSADARAASAWVGDPDAVRFVPLGPLSAAQAVDYVEQLMSEAARNPRDGYTLALVERSTGEVVGSVALGIDSRVHRRAEIGYILRRDRWGRGYATEAANLVIDFAIQQLGMHRVWAVCDPENPASVRVLEKCGMQCEGRLRDDLLVHGSWRDSLLYATVATDRASLPERYV
jgi:ribosomal-protein-alanine N-acetyltransferase